MSKMSYSKIILKSTTKMSLNDRFTVLRKENPSLNEDSNTGVKERRLAQQATRKNQRLAAQMEKRPAVVAALKKEKFQNVHNRLNGQQNIPIKQRLAMEGRLRLPESNRGNLRMRGSQIRGRGQILTRNIKNDNDRAFQGRGRFRGIGTRIGQNFTQGQGRGGEAFFRGGRGRGAARRGGRGTSRPFRRGV